MTENIKKETPDSVDPTAPLATSTSETQTDSSTPEPTNTHDTQTVTDDASQTRPNKKITALAAASFGLSIIALATSGWLYYQSMQSSFQHDVAQIQKQQTASDKKISANTLNQVQLIQTLEQVKKATQAAQADKQQSALQLAQQSQNTDKLLSLEAKLDRINNTTKEDWKLAEAEYLIRLASQRLLLESDSASAVSLLSNADDILKELKDPIVFDARKALAKDIQALSSSRAFDLEGAYLKLNALYESLSELPQREPSKEFQTQTEQEQLSDSTTQQTIESTIQSVWQSIRSLVVINYNHKPIKALLPPAEYQELIVGLQLQLDIAQLALIKGESTIYQQALARIANATTEHFDTQSDVVIAFLASLTALQQLNSAPELPLPNASLANIKQLVLDWNGREILTPDQPIEETAESATQETLPTPLEIEAGGNP